MSIKLHTENIPGNIHDAAVAINKWGWAEYLVHMDYSNYSTVCVFRMPAEKVHEIRSNNRAYVADPRHDDYRGPVDKFSQFAKIPQTIMTQQEANGATTETETMEVHSPSEGEPGYRGVSQFAEETAQQAAAETVSQAVVKEPPAETKTSRGRTKAVKPEAPADNGTPVETPSNPANPTTPTDDLPSWART